MLKKFYNEICKIEGDKDFEELAEKEKKLLKNSLCYHWYKRNLKIKRPFKILIRKIKNIFKNK